MSGSKVNQAGIQQGTGMLILLFCLVGCSLFVNSNNPPGTGPLIPTVSDNGIDINTRQPPASQATPPAPIVSPYIDVAVTGIEVIFLDTHPVQVELIIHGSLPDQCAYDFYSIENRTPDQVKITLKGIHPSTLDCAQTVQNIDHSLRLGQDFPEIQRGFEPGSYQLTVNGYQTTFVIDP
jgi:hypothetical protein